MALSNETAANRYQSKFPENKLIEFRGADNPCVVLCHKHGEQTVSSFSNIVRSQFGCPKCASEYKMSVARGAQKKVKEDHKNLTKELCELAFNTETSSDEFRLAIQSSKSFGEYVAGLNRVADVAQKEPKTPSDDFEEWAERLFNKKSDANPNLQTQISQLTTQVSRLETQVESLTAQISQLLSFIKDK